ncbi:MAG TPA: hypothetical protein VFN08_18570 [Gemmatimonadales bacterium]|jgi:hypothetical protein|nr:hypothetical protein [Gemmatimonadales bacterium]
MDQPIGRPADTREFMAMWNAVTAEHLTHKLAAALEELAQRLPNAPAFGTAGAEMMAPLLLHAFQVAAAKDGGVHAAVQFLVEYGASPAPEP